MFNTHLVSDLDGEAETRGFSCDCEVFTNGGGQICTKCSKVKCMLNLKRVRQRKKLGVEGRGLQVDPRCNHRYMTREQLIQKISNAKKLCQEQIRMRKKMEKEMIEIEEADHFDLVKMMDGVGKTDIPEDMDVLWEQQKSILKASSSNRFRWHPRYLACVTNVD
jgi:hypothetical protein